MLVKKDIDENDHERLFNVTLGHKLKKMNRIFITNCMYTSIIYSFISYTEINKIMREILKVTFTKDPISR